MDETGFWRLIDASRAATKGDLDEQVDDLRERLEKLAPAEIVEFDRRRCDLMRRAFTWNLWGAAYVINGGCSDDGFEYFRSWLIAKGPAVYAAALKDADSLVKLVTEDDQDHGCECEDLAYVAVQAWDTKTGRDGAFPYDRSPAQPGPSGEAWNEDDDELRARFPKLHAKFG